MLKERKRVGLKKRLVCPRGRIFAAGRTLLHIRSAFFFGKDALLRSLTDEKGFVLPTALVFLAVLALLGTTAVFTTTQDMTIGGNHRHSEQAFNHAWAGGEEARARLRAKAIHPIADDKPPDPQWRAYIGSSEAAGEYGFDAANAMHQRYDSLLPDWQYTVRIRHQVDAHGHVMYWGDADGDGVNERNPTTGETIYVITSFGSAGGSCKILEAEAARTPDVTAPCALYVKAPSIIEGDTSFVVGYDACGTKDNPGVITTRPPGSVTLQGDPHVTGKGGGEPNVLYNGTDMDIQRLVHFLKKPADFSYLANSADVIAATKPGPADGWGTPVFGATFQDPSACSASHVVYYDTDGTFVRFSDGVSGCGLLLIEGDLKIQGDFSWYGPVCVTGSVVFDNGGDKHITGALLVGGAAVVDPSGGHNGIVYCSQAVSGHTGDGPLRLLSWKEYL
jgi:hypothetical protein